MHQQHFLTNLKRKQLFQVKGLLIDSKLPVATLGKIWDLADMDKDGSLDRHEFLVVI